MALLNDIFFARRSTDSSSEEAGSPLEKPTFAESFFGFGKAVKERDIQVKRIYKEYHAQKNDFLKDSRRQQRDLEKSLAKKKERHFSQYGYGDLADSRITKDQLRKDPKLRDVVRDFNQDKNRAKRKFEKQQREGLKQLQKNRDEQRHVIFQRTHNPQRGMASNPGKTTLAA